MLYFGHGSVSFHWFIALSWNLYKSLKEQFLGKEPLGVFINLVTALIYYMFGNDENYEKYNLYDIG